jgi:hypothetical protein
MKRITLYRASSDNAGLFVDAGTELKIGDDAKSKTITADLAQELIDSGGAIDPDAAPAKGTDTKPAAKQAETKAPVQS